MSDGPKAPAGAFPFGIYFRRALRVDLDPVTVLPDEHDATEVERIHGHSEAMRKMLLWRRAALFVAFVLQLPPTLVHLIKGFIAVGDKAQATDLAGLDLMLALANVALVVALWVAFGRWSRWSSSKKVLYWAWLIAFVLPFALSLIPYRAVLKAGGGAQGGLIGVLAGFAVIVQLGPKVLALVPGLLRAAVVAKVMFPSSPTPGAAMTMGAPFYLLLLYVILLIPYQVAGGALMAPALILLMAAPIFMWRAGKALSRPRSTDDVVAVVKAMKTTTLITNAIGAVFLLIGLIDVISDLNMSPLDAILPLLQVVANIFTLSIVGVDLMLTALMRQHVASLDAEHKEGVATYAREMGAFVEAAELAGVSAQPIIPKDPLPPQPVAPKPKPVVPLKPPPPRAPAAVKAPAADDPLGETQPGGPPPK